jgi:hypothetical protein
MYSLSCSLATDVRLIQIYESENMKTKARNSKMKLFNVVKLRKCENHRFVFGYFYYKSADKL